MHIYDSLNCFRDKGKQAINLLKSAIAETFSNNVTIDVLLIFYKNTFKRIQVTEYLLLKLLQYLDFQRCFLFGEMDFHVI